MTTSTELLKQHFQLSQRKAFDILLRNIGHLIFLPMIDIGVSHINEYRLKHKRAT